MIHKGKLLEQKIRTSGKSISDVGEKLGISRSTIYRWFEDPDLKDKYFRKVGEVIGYTFSKEVPGLFAIEDMEVRDIMKSDPRCMKILDERNKYLVSFHESQRDLIKAKDEVNELLRENARLNRELAILKAKS